MQEHGDCPAPTDKVCLLDSPYSILALTARNHQRQRNLHYLRYLWFFIDGDESRESEGRRLRDVFRKICKKEEEKTTEYEKFKEILNRKLEQREVYRVFIGFDSQGGFGYSIGVSSEELAQKYFNKIISEIILGKIFGELISKYLQNINKIELTVSTIYCLRLHVPSKYECEYIIDFWKKTIETVCNAFKNIENIYRNHIEEKLHKSINLKFNRHIIISRWLEIPESDQRMYFEMLWECRDQLKEKFKSNELRKAFNAFINRHDLNSLKNFLSQIVIKWLLDVANMWNLKTRIKGKLLRFDIWRSWEYERGLCNYLRNISQSSNPLETVLFVPPLEIVTHKISDHSWKYHPGVLDEFRKRFNRWLVELASKGLLDVMAKIGEDIFPDIWPTRNILL